MIPATKQHGSLQRPAGSELLQLWAAECFFPAGGMESGNNGGTTEHSLFQRPDFFRTAKPVHQDKRRLEDAQSHLDSHCLGQA